MTDSGFSETLQFVTERAIASFEDIHGARELALGECRKAIQLASRSIRATHRGEFEEASKLVSESGTSVARAVEALGAQPALRSSGFLTDGEKEYAEAAITLAFVQGATLPTPEDLNTGYASYLNGLAEAASELRRSALDAIRNSDTQKADRLLSMMDEAMSVLTSVDFPEGVTGGLRRTTDQLRAVTERTRGDVTQAIRQASLERRLSDLESELGKQG